MSPTKGAWTLPVLFILLSHGAGNAEADPGWRVPEGFEVSLYAGDELAHDIFSLTIDAKGRVVVAGEGYVKILHDDNCNGRADRATRFSEGPRGGARGMYFDGDDLMAAADDGLYRFHDRDGDGVADGTHERWMKTDPGGHAANGIVKGPDGWYYWITGNDAGVGGRHITLSGSPVQQPQAGGLLRIAPDGSESEVLAHGFRNPYDLAFNQHGHPFTYDADGERIRYLPWYTPTRIFDIAQGMHHGWVLKGWVHAWNRPVVWLDNVERLYEVGRGSPTGVLVYRHRQFPERYQGGLFALCWSLGRLYFFPLEQDGATYATEMETFLEGRGDSGFAPVGMAVGPKGSLYIAIGGRGTKGSVYRVRYSDGEPPSPGGDGLDRVLQADQPLSSWSRAEWVPAARALGRDRIEDAVLDEGRLLGERIRGVEILVEVFDGVSPRLAREIERAGSPALAARAVWAVGRSGKAAGVQAFLSERTYREHPLVVRAAWEGLMALSGIEPDLEPPPDWLGGFGHASRRIRAAAMETARGGGLESLQETLPKIDRLKEPRAIVGMLYAEGVRGEADGDEINRYWRQALRAWREGDDPAVRVDSIRLLQIGLGDVHLIQDQRRLTDGYIAGDVGRVDRALRREAAEELAAEFPTGDSRLDRETARLFAMLGLELPEVLESFTDLWGETTPVEEDIHYLLAACQIEGERSKAFTQASARAFANLHSKMRAANQQPSRFWPTRVQNAFESLAKLDRDLPRELVETAEFGSADHALFVEVMESPVRSRAIRELFDQARQEPQSFDWSPQVVKLMGELPDSEVRDLLRAQWPTPLLQPALVRVLSDDPTDRDKGRFVAALASTDAGTVRRSAKALRALPSPNEQEEALAAAIGALQRFCSFPDEDETRRSLRKLLEYWTGTTFEISETDDPFASHEPWFEWFADAYPEQDAALSGGAIVGVGKWRQRLSAVDWQGGDPQQGRRIFQERQCHQCHMGRDRLGPDLDRITSRFSVEDLFLEIAAPDRNISPAYTPKEVMTRSGRTYRGIAIYQSPATLMLQTGPSQTVRLTEGEVMEVREGSQSFMPQGLLNGLDDSDLIDLYAYLKTLD